METASLNRILMIEDDLDIQAVARLALESLGGFTVEVCSRGHEALETAPVQFFLEVAFSLAIAPFLGTGLDAGIGVRYYF